MRRIYWLCLLCLTFLLTSCGFHLQGEMPLAPPLHRLYLQIGDPYGQLASNLKLYLKLSHVQLVDSPEQATTVLAILHDDTSQELLSVSGTQQTRQYTLRVNVTFAITDAKGRTLVGEQSISDSRTITVQSNQILGSSNETTLFYSHMRRTLAYAIMKRMASKEMTQAINNAYRAQLQAGQS